VTRAKPQARRISQIGSTKPVLSFVEGSEIRNNFK
jgi:hypothetical protein